MTQGFACHKGLAAIHVTSDPDRLHHPAVRERDGTWRSASWDEAMAIVATRLEDIVARHGPAAVSAYVGNPTAFNALASVHLSALLRGIGTRRTFSSGTQDCANKFAASE